MADENLIIKVEAAKSFLRVDYNDDDDYIQELIKAAEKYIGGAMDRPVNPEDPRVLLLCKVLVKDWYDNRNFMARQPSEKVRHTVQTILTQLKYETSESGAG